MREPNPNPNKPTNIIHSTDKSEQVQKVQQLQFHTKKEKLVSKFIANNLNLVQQCVWFCLLHFLRWEKFLSYFGSFFQSTHTKYYLSSLPSHTFSLGNSLGIKIKNWFSKMLNSMSNYRHKFSTLILRNKIWFFFHHG